MTAASKSESQAFWGSSLALRLPHVPCLMFWGVPMVRKHICLMRRKPDEGSKQKEKKRNWLDWACEMNYKQCISSTGEQNTCRALGIYNRAGERWKHARGHWIHGDWRFRSGFEYFHSTSTWQVHFILCEVQLIRAIEHMWYERHDFSFFSTS